MVSGSFPSGNDPDGVTIAINNDGNLEARNLTIYGDFESGSGSWTLQNSGTRVTGSTGAESTSCFVEGAEGTSGNSENFLDRTINFDNISEFVFYLGWSISGNTSRPDSTDSMELRIGGTTKASLAGDTEGEWVKYKVDASNISGDQSVNAVIVNQSGEPIRGCIDRIKGDVTEGVVLDGEGGT